MLIGEVSKTRIVNNDPCLAAVVASSVASGVDRATPSASDQYERLLIQDQTV